ncbi:MAG TPA: hypothetical protein VGM42_11290 [Rhodopila sp.]|jgi:uncharacterized membrane protein
MNLDAWIRQPSTLHGIGVMAAGVGAALAQVATGNPKVDAVVAVVGYVLVHLGINDNSSLQTSVTAFTDDLLHGAAPVKMLGDATAVEAAAAPVAVAPAAPVAAVAVVPNAGPVT